VLFLDEPTTGLDPLWDIVRELTGGGVTVLLTTQYLEEADQLAANIAVVDHGRVIATGTPSELKAAAGAQTLAVKPADPADLPRTLAEVAALAGPPEVAGTTVTAQVADPALLPALVRRLDDAGVLIAELTLRGSTLDEVFLSLTGHRVAPESKTEPERSLA
jgi:oleandomycin transport system ATP-binding protein